MDGRTADTTLNSAHNISEILVETPSSVAECIQLVEEQIPLARQHLDADDTLTQELRLVLGRALAASGDVARALTVLDDVYSQMRRILGDAHPRTNEAHQRLLEARALAAPAKPATRKRRR